MLIVSKSKLAAVLLGLSAFSGAALIDASVSGVAMARDPVVGGAPMLPSQNIVENAGNAKDLSTLVAAIKAAGLTDVLKGPGPFTVFAPTNAAFKKLPPGTVDNLLKPENQSQLQSVLTYHIVAAALTSKDLAEKIKAGGGKAELKTIQGEPVTIEMKGRTLEVADAKGDVAKVLVANVSQSNGVVYVIDTVLLP